MSEVNRFDLATPETEKGFPPDIGACLQEFQTALSAIINGVSGNTPVPAGGDSAAAEARQSRVPVRDYEDGQSDGSGLTHDLNHDRGTVNFSSSTSLRNQSGSFNSDNLGSWNNQSGDAFFRTANYESTPVVSGLSPDSDAKSNLPVLLGKIAEEAVRQTALLDYLRQDIKDLQNSLASGGGTAVEL